MKVALEAVADFVRPVAMQVLLARERLGSGVACNPVQEWPWYGAASPGSRWPSPHSASTAIIAASTGRRWAGGIAW